MGKITKLVACLLFLGIGAYAQTITGTISGRIIDQQQAAVAGASVTVTDPAKGVSVATTSNTQGDFYAAGLQPGTYSVSVEAKGFKKLTRTAIPLNANDKLAIGDLILDVGAVTETVEVTGQAALLQTQSAERSEAIVGKQIENIEVNGRNPLDMAKLVPGIQFTNGANYAVGNSGTGANQFTVNGARPSQNQLSLNGIGNVDTGNNGGMNVSVSTDSIAEFKILTGDYQAEFGRSVGGQINVVTKSGTDDFHGSGYWYHRNDSLNANTYINNLRGLAKPLFRYNDPGYTIGGPIMIPKVFEKLRHRAFFFFSQEFQRQLLPNSAKNVLVPTAAERAGDFSASRDQNGNLIAAILDPTTRQPYPNKQVPSSLIYKPGQNLLNLYPLPNATGTNFNYTSQVPGASPRQETLLRGDLNVTDKMRVWVHWVDNRQPTLQPYGSFVLGLTVPITNISNPIPGRSIAGGMTYSITPTMTNEFNLGFTHNSILIDESGTVLKSASTIGLPVLYPSAVQSNYVPNVTFNGSHINASPGFGSGDAPFINYNTTIDIVDNLTKVWGAHTLKAGVYLQRSRKDQTSFANFNGSYNFGDNTSNPYDTGYGFSNALLGVYNTFNQAANHINGMYRYWNIEQYLQDTWRVTPRLTLDYGLRAAWYQPQYDSSLQASTWIPSQYNVANAPRLYVPAINPATNARAAYDPGTGTYQPTFDIGLEVAGTGQPFQGLCQGDACPGFGKYLMKDRGLQWGPRFGFAWDVLGDQKLVLRAGSGIYYDRIQGNRTFDMVTNPPEAVSPTLNQNLVSTIKPGNVLIGPPGLDVADPTGKVPTVYQYQMGVQYQLPSNMALDVAYVGNLGRHESDNVNLNYNPFGQCFLPQNQDPALQASNPTALLGNNCLPQNQLKKYLGYGSINLYQAEATSNYNALQVGIQRRTTKGLFLGASYTWSKALATAQSGGTNDNSFVRPDNLNRLMNYGASSFDRRQVLAINYVYETPKLRWGNGFSRLITDGWQLSGVTQLQTGAPFTPGFSVQNAGNQNITGSYTEGARVGVVAGCDPYTHLSDPFNRLNPNCFFAPSIGSIGTESGVNFLYGPGVWNFDISVEKIFRIKERARIQLRLDAFNAFNHTDFSGYNSSVSFNAYPTTNGIVTGVPTLATSSLGRNPSTGAFNVNGFGASTQVGPGALGYSRILQTVLRFTF